MKIPTATIAAWEKKISEWLFSEKQLLPADITTRGDAWFVAHRAGCIKPLQGDRTINDSHIETALKQIFVNVNWERKRD